MSRSCECATRCGEVPMYLAFSEGWLGSLDGSQDNLPNKANRTVQDGSASDTFHDFHEDKGRFSCIALDTP